MRNRVIVVLLGSFVASAAAVAADRLSLELPLQVIANTCHLEGWQYALTPNDQNEVRVELSPTIGNEQVVCVYQTLSDYNVPLDRPAPVQVVKNAITQQPITSSQEAGMSQYSGAPH
jgi:hypothetical protein